VFVCIWISHMIKVTQVHLINSGFKQNARVHAFRDAGVRVFTPFRMCDPNAYGSGSIWHCMRSSMGGAGQWRVETTVEHDPELVPAVKQHLTDSL